MKSDFSQFDELIARCLSGECGPEELARLRSIILDTPDLQADVELMTVLFGKNGIGQEPDKKHFSRITKRLEDDGLM